jgi:hypothetical protein
MFKSAAEQARVSMLIMSGDVVEMLTDVSSIAMRKREHLVLVNIMISGDVQVSCITSESI